MRSSDRAWLAGFFDGEGCFQVAHRYNRAKEFRCYSEKCSIGQADPRVLYKVQRIAGGRINGPYKTNSLTTYYAWSITGKSRVHEFARIVWPYLGEVKKLQYRTMQSKVNQSRLDSTR